MASCIFNSTTVENQDKHRQTTEPPPLIKRRERSSALLSLSSSHHPFLSALPPLSRVHRASLPSQTKIMDAKVNLFNNFPRPKNLPGGQYPNHWIIGVCHVDVQDTYDLVLAINPLSQDVKKTPRQAEILSLPTIHDKAEEIIPILLDAFACPLDGFDSPMEPFAPWTWSTLDPDMAQALEDALQKHGVKPELCQVGVCTAEERAFLEAIRDGCVTRLARLVGRKRSIVAWGDSTKCHGCDMSSDCFFQPLKRCTGCEKAYYHSKKCQKKHWKQHKAGCRAARDYSDSPELKSYSFLNQEALADPEARALWTSLSIPATERPLCTVCVLPPPFPPPKPS